MLSFKDSIRKFGVGCPFDSAQFSNCEGCSCTLVKVFAIALQDGRLKFFSVVQCYCVAVWCLLLNKCNSWFWWMQDPSEFAVALLDSFCFEDTSYNLFCGLVPSELVLCNESFEMLCSVDYGLFAYAS